LAHPRSTCVYSPTCRGQASTECAPGLASELRHVEAYRAVRGGGGGWACGGGGVAGCWDALLSRLCQYGVHCATSTSGSGGDRVRPAPRPQRAPTQSAPTLLKHYCASVTRGKQRAWASDKGRRWCPYTGPQPPGWGWRGVGGGSAGTRGWAAALCCSQHGVWWLHLCPEPATCRRWWAQHGRGAGLGWRGPTPLPWSRGPPLPPPPPSAAPWTKSFNTSVQILPPLW